jgi:hypothetical protein
LCAGAIAAAPMAGRADPAVQGIEFGAIPIVLWALFANAPEEPQQDYVTFGGGIFDAVDGIDRAGEFRFEFRPGLMLWKFKPFIGMAATSDAGFYAYGGLRIDAYFGRRIVASPSFALVGYHRGDGKDLGSSGVARSGFDIAWRFDDDSQLGVAFHHMSHGEVFGHVNPGTEMVAVTYSIPLSRIFGGR